jgi:hypothetical protein
MVGVPFGMALGLLLGYVVWRLPALQRRYMNEKQDTPPEVEFIRKIKETPLRSMEDIRLNREPEWVQPIVAQGMQRDVPRPPRLGFTGPPPWMLSSWMIWNYGDFLGLWSRHVGKQNGGRHRILRSM